MILQGICKRRASIGSPSNYYTVMRGSHRGSVIESHAVLYGLDTVPEGF